MKELRAILNAISQMPPHESAVLATLVKVEGSAFRSPGARMLVLPDGRHIGAISGGCLEADLCERAMKLPENAPPQIITYSTGDMQETLLGYGMGCMGTMHVMLERIAAERPPAYIRSLRETDFDSPTVLVTVLRSDDSTDLRTGDRLLLDRQHTSTQGTWPGELQDGVAGIAHSVLAAGRSSWQTFRGLELFIEFLRPSLRLLIFGAGETTVPLARFADELGWRITVFDKREAFAEKSRFTGSADVMLAPAVQALTQLPKSGTWAAVVMTHNYPDDLALLRGLLASDAAYIGLLGARSRRDKLVSDLGSGIGETQLRRLHAPIGLDLGADSPEEIALSIIAEILAVTRNRPSLPLRDRTSPIHDSSVP